MTRDILAGMEEREKTNPSNRFADAVASIEGKIITNGYVHGEYVRLLDSSKIGVATLFPNGVRVEISVPPDLKELEVNIDDPFQMLYALLEEGFRSKISKGSLVLDSRQPLEDNPLLALVVEDFKGIDPREILSHTISDVPCGDGWHKLNCKWDDQLEYNHYYQAAPGMLELQDEDMRQLGSVLRFEL